MEIMHVMNDRSSEVNIGESMIHTPYVARLWVIIFDNSFPKKNNQNISHLRQKYIS